LYAYARSHYSFKGGILLYFFDLTIGILCEHFWAGGKSTFVRLRVQEMCLLLRRGSHGLALRVRLVGGLYFCLRLRATTGIAEICRNEKSLAQNFGFVQGFGVLGLVFLPTW
jgi:hypothetical protein